MEKKLTIKELLRSGIISSKYLSKVSGLSYCMLRQINVDSKSAPDYYVGELNKALKQIATELNNIIIVNDDNKNGTVVCN